MTRRRWAVPLIRRLPSNPHPSGARLAELFLREGVVYGIAEGVLLATLPVLAAWQLVTDLGWTEGTWGKVGSGALAVTAALLVIAHILLHGEIMLRGMELPPGHSLR